MNRKIMLKTLVFAPLLGLVKRADSEGTSGLQQNPLRQADFQPAGHIGELVKIPYPGRYVRDERHFYFDNEWVPSAEDIKEEYNKDLKPKLNTLGKIVENLMIQHQGLYNHFVVHGLQPNGYAIGIMEVTIRKRTKEIINQTSVVTSKSS